jgi:hypothetical protein
LPLSKKTLVSLLLVIVAVGLVLRLLGLVWGHGYYQSGIHDDMEAFRVAVNYLEGDAKAQYLGQPKFNEGKIAGPLWAMFWSAPLRFGGSTVPVFLTIIVLNTAAIPLVYLLARKMFGPSCALWAALFYAISPWPVHFSISCNNPSVLAPLGVLLFLALWDVCTTPRSIHIFWVCLLAAAIPQFHMVGVFYIPFVVFIILLSGNRINRTWLAAGVFAAVVLYLPYIAGEMNNHWENTRQILSKKSKFQFGVLKVLTLQVNVLSNFFSRWTGYRFSEYRAFGDAMLGSFYVLATFNIMSVALGILSLGDFLRDFFRSFRGCLFSLRQVFSSAPATMFMGVLLFGPILLFALTGHDFVSRYLCLQLPLLFCLPALFLQKVLQSHRWQPVLVGGMILTVAFNVAITPVFFYYQKSQIEQAALFVPTFPGMEAVYRSLRADAPPNARIRVDYKEAVPMTQGAVSLVGRNLSEYVAMRDELYFLGRKPGADRCYRLVPARTDTAGVHSVYESNGIRLVSCADSAPQ